MAKGDLAAAVKEAATEALEAQAEGTGSEPEATAETQDQTPVSQEVSTDVAASEPVDAEAFKKAWGVDLSILPDEAARHTFVEEWAETQKTIGKLQRKNAELEKAVAAPPAAPAPVEDADEPVDVSKLSDEQIAQALGINFQDADERDLRDIALTRTALEQEDRLERMERALATSSRASSWDKAFDALEAANGPLPADTLREDVFAWADENGVASPDAAYWAAVGPVRAAVAQALNSRIIELKTDGKKASTTLRPTGSAPVDPVALKAKTVKAAVPEAFEKARQALGYKLRDE